MDNFTKNMVAKFNPELTLIGKEYVKASEDLLEISKKLAHKGDLVVETLRPSYENQFTMLQIKDDALRDFIREFGFSKKTKNFILKEMEEVSKLSREITSIIKKKMKELSV